MTIASLDRAKLSGGGASEPHAKELLDKTDALITQSNTNTGAISTNTTNIGTNATGIAANLLALDQKDDNIRGDVDFSHMGSTAYAENYDLTGVTGTGTNDITGGKAVLTTTGAANDRESTVGRLAVFNRGDRVRTSMAVDDVTNVKTTFGLYLAANKYLLVSLNTAVDANFHLDLDDTTGAETEDLAITPVNGTAYDIELWTEADGTPHVAINGVEIVLAVIAKKLTAEAYVEMWDVETLTTAARVLSIDWEKFKRAI